MQIIIWSLAIISASALLYGGNGGSESYIGCESGNYVEAIKVHSGARLDGLQIKCTNQNWSAWKGGYGGGRKYMYSRANGFCGMFGRHGASIDKLCLVSAAWGIHCAGGWGGSHFEDRSCSDDAPGDNRARLTGFYVRSGAEIDGLTPTWDTNIDCPHYLQVSNSPYSSSFDGFYSFDRFHNGHHLYKHNVNNGCIYYSSKAWRFSSTCNTGLMTMFGWTTGSWSMKLEASSHYDICPGELGGQTSWYYNGEGYIYPTLQLRSHDSLPFEWGNAVGYWAHVSSGSGSSGGATRTWTTSVTDTSSTSRTYSTTEEESFSQTESQTHTWGIELGVSTEKEFKVVKATASMKWSYTASLTSSTTQTTSVATTNALSYAQSVSNTASESCGSEAPTFGGRWGIGNTPWILYAWEVYRASSVENVGATQTTCEFQYQTGPCRFVPPNCPLGACLDEHCVQCIAGVEPFKSLSVLQSEYPGCLDSLDIEAEAPRCALQNYDWNCCSADSPCELHQGDCDNDSHCAEELVCSQNEFCRDNPDQCPHSTFDVCVAPDSLDIEAEPPRCALQNFDWDCCSASSPCGLHQGDCDNDSHCAGELVCSQNEFCRDNPDQCPDSTFDVCVAPDRRELSSSFRDEDGSSNKASDEFTTRFSRQISRLLEDEKGVHSVPKDLDEAPNVDEIPVEEEEDPISGCIQFDDEGHCTTGPLYKYCRWEAEQCVNKENVKDVPEGDFTYVYGF